MEEKDKLTLNENERLLKRKETATLVVDKEEEVSNEIKTEQDVLLLRKQLADEKQLKLKLAKKEQAVVDTPNYDMIKEISPEKRKQIYKIEKTETKVEKKPFSVGRKFKFIIFAIIFLISGAFCISSGVNLANASSMLAESQAEYELNLAKLLKKISKTDSGNKMLELIETYPSEFNDPSSIAEQTNWFDKICNFLSGLFGG